MNEQTFNYLGYRVKPIGNILGGFFVKTNFMTWEYKIIPVGYDYDAFYKKARKHHSSVDVYEINGKLYIPNKQGFIGLTSNVVNSIKRCEDYAHYYKWARKN